MKKIYKYLFLLIILLLVGCDSNSSIATYNVTFDANGGALNCNEHQTIDEGLKVGKPTDPEKTGYSFVGWFLNDKEWDFKVDRITKDITLTAEWTIGNYLITIRYADGVNNDLTVKKEYGEKINLEKDLDNFLDKKLTRVGYCFEGWSETSIPETMPANDITINAIWKCQVKYNISNGSAIVSEINCKEKDIVILDSYEGYPTTTIDSGAFYLTNLKSITLPNSITYIGDRAFLGCLDLTSITLSNSITYIGDRAFYDCESLTSITLPNSITYIGDEAFYYCVSLTSITLSNSITYIGDEAFNYCESLTSITLPNSITYIGYEAFNYCESLTSINYEGTIKEWKKIKRGSYYGIDSYTIHCTDGDIIK